VIDGHQPTVLFIGAEFCPLCAAERWATVIALSNFGKWSGLQTTTSSPYDSYPLTNTFTFRSASITSPYVYFKLIENETNDNSGANTRQQLQPVSNYELGIWTHYMNGQTGYPFMDINNKVIFAGPSYNPQILQGLTWDQIAADLSNPQSPVTQAIVGTANYITAGICAVTGQQPASVCTAAPVPAVQRAMGLG